MTEQAAERVINGLTDFQQASVRHVIKQFYGPANASRFLVADETGLGKSMVARGVIARAIHELQGDDSVQRIDIVYVCSNADLAKQNLTRLKVTDDLVSDFESRLTLLGKHSHALNKKVPKGTKAVNLIAFTPGTSFDMGHSTGMAEERALLFLAITDRIDLSRAERTAALRLLQGNVRSKDRFAERVQNLDDALPDGIDRSILREFYKGIERGGRKGLLDRFRAHIEQTLGKHSVPDGIAEANRQLVGELRAELARASVETLEPDLIILDEFQRFKSLLDDQNPSGELAHHLFNYPMAKVLLLSATPYKPFTYAEESDDDHAKDLVATLTFLAQGRTDVSVEEIQSLLRDYRENVTQGKSPVSTVADLRTELLKIMSRSERPSLGNLGMRAERVRTADSIRPEDLVGFVRLKEVAQELSQERDQPLVSVEYWKSAPYFINFCDGYKIGHRVRDAIADGYVPESLTRTQHIAGGAITRFRPLDGGNARMRDLVDATVGKGWWKLLWVPPSMPYFEPAGPYAEPELRTMTKQVVFSSWAATPTAVASVLSYEAERLACQKSDKYTAYTPENRKKLTQPLNYSMRDGKAGRMSTLLAFWPMRRFAELADPFTLLAGGDGTPLDPRAALAQVRGLLRDELSQLSESGTGSSSELARDSGWRTAFAHTGNWPIVVDELTEPSAFIPKPSSDNAAGSSDEDAVEVEGGHELHIREALDVVGSLDKVPDDDLLTTLSTVALYSPGNIALRSVRRLLPASHDLDERDVFLAASALANGLRSLFNRPDVTTLIEQLTTSESYWQRILDYSAWGNLESVLDEYLYHLRQDQFSGDLDAKRLLELAHTAAAATSLRSSKYQAIDPSNVEEDLTFVPRIALRYGGRQQKTEDVRQPEVRRSFNSPFWPLVLTSTSVGQEGIDFHWWCHSVFHWNTPANPVDFEQREGRVDRYQGLAIRRNVAERHASAVLAAPGLHPWETAIELAKDLQDQYGEFAPHWVYPGSAMIERHVAPFALSSDLSRYEQIKRDVALYRLTFGQPRQEDMLELLRRQGLDESSEGMDSMRIDLSPPRN